MRTMNISKIAGILAISSVRERIEARIAVAEHGPLDAQGQAYLRGLLDALSDLNPPPTESAVPDLTAQLQPNSDEQTDYHENT